MTSNHSDRQIKIGDIYLIKFEGGGSVQKGLRPGLVFQNNTGNKYSPNLIMLPLTTQLKKVDQPTHVVIPAEGTGLKRDSMVLCENPECIAKERLGAYITTISDKYMKMVAAAHLVATSAISFIDPEMFNSLWEQASQLNGV